MPRGYTSYIEDNISFKNWALICARNFGACITLREETEWVETVDHGWNKIAGTDFDKIVKAVGSAKKGKLITEYGEGKASENIVEILMNKGNLRV